MLIRFILFYFSLARRTRSKRTVVAADVTSRDRARFYARTTRNSSCHCSTTNYTLIGAEDSAVKTDNNPRLVSWVAQRHSRYKQSHHQTQPKHVGLAETELGARLVLSSLAFASHRGLIPNST